MKKVKVQFPKLGAQYATQQTNKAVAATKNPVSREKHTAELRKLIEQSPVPKEDLIKIGRLAEAAIKDKSKYSDYAQYFIDKGVDPEKMKKPDYQAMSSLVVLSKVAQGM